MPETRTGTSHISPFTEVCRLVCTNWQRACTQFWFDFELKIPRMREFSSLFVPTMQTSVSLSLVSPFPPSPFPPPPYIPPSLLALLPPIFSFSPSLHFIPPSHSTSLSPSFLPASSLPSFFPLAHLPLPPPLDQVTLLQHCQTTLGVGEGGRLASRPPKGGRLSR